MHLSIDPEMNMHEVQITETEMSDIEKMDDLIPEEIALLLEKVIADGAYYSKETVEGLYNQGILPAIPPPPNSEIQGKETTQWHDKIEFKRLQRYKNRPVLYFILNI
jgi:hypothetical protein